MPFWLNVVSMFMGSTMGFLFSIALFYFIAKIKEKRELKSLEESLIKEWEYNESLLSEFIDEITKVIEKISVDNKKTFTYLKYSDFMSFFTMQYFQKGYLVKKLQIRDLKPLSKMLNHMNQNVESYVNLNIRAWENGNIEKMEILSIMEYQRDTIKQFIKDIPHLKQLI